MTRRRENKGKDQTLLDLPLSQPQPPRVEGAEQPAAPGTLEQRPRQGFAPPQTPDPRAALGERLSGRQVLPPWEEIVAGKRSVSGSVSIVRRIAAGLVDLLSVGLAVWVVLLGASRLGIEWDLRLWPGALMFALSFSFFYVTLPLLFWGQTAGMAVAGLRAWDRDERQHLHFLQAVVYWGCGVVSVGSLFVPLLIALSGRSLAERVSGSIVLQTLD